MLAIGHQDGGHFYNFVKDDNNFTEAFSISV